MSNIVKFSFMFAINIIKKLFCELSFIFKTTFIKPLIVLLVGVLCISYFYFMIFEILYILYKF